MKWLWLVVGNSYLQCDGLGEFGVLDEVGGLTVWGWGGFNGLKCLKRRWNEKIWDVKTGMLCKGVGALKKGGGGCDSFTNCE